MKVLVSTSSAKYTSETIEYNGNKFKIRAENGNSFSYLRIELYTPNGLSSIACEYDIPKYQGVHYIWDDARRIKVSKENIKAAENYIKKIF